MKTRPKAFQSPLWEYLEQIRTWRRARATWVEISQRLKAEHGLEITVQGVHRFFKRSTKTRLPLGFGETAKPTKREPRPQKSRSAAAHKR
jgi:hypothetical protein